MRRNQKSFLRICVSTTALLGACLAGGITALSQPGPAGAAEYSDAGACGTSGTFTSTGAFAGTCTYTDAGADTFTVPDSPFPTTLTFTLYGAGGAYINNDGVATGSATGYGGEAVGTLAVSAASPTPDVLEVNVGAPADDTFTSGLSGGFTGTGGFNGGGNSPDGPCAGAGASDVRELGSDGTYSLSDRLFVAGGGGGLFSGPGTANYPQEQGASNGGGVSGAEGQSQGDGSSDAGGGGNQQGGGSSGPLTQSAGFGFGGTGAPIIPEVDTQGGCGGGGGYYGGGASGAGQTAAGGGGGGSGYVTPAATDTSLVQGAAQGVNGGTGQVVIAFSTDPSYVTTTTVTSSANPSLPGAPVTFTATVTTPGSSQLIGGGSVNFIDDTTFTTLATVPVSPTGGDSATATYTTSTLAVGTDPIGVGYSGYVGSSYADSSSRVGIDQAVSQSQTVSFTSMAPQDAAVGSTYQVTASATSSLPVTFSIDASTASQCSLSGTTVSFLSTGPCLIHANQAGNGTYAPATGVNQLVHVTVTTPSAIQVESINPSTQVSNGSITMIGQAFEIQAELGPKTPPGVDLPAATGTVSFTDNQTNGQACSNVAITHNNGATFADCDLTESLAGDYDITASYSGDSTYSPSSASVTEFVDATAGTITFTSINPSPASIGSTYDVTATTNAGALTFSIETNSGTECSIIGSTVTFLKAGSCFIDAFAAATTGVSAATGAQIVTISAPSLTTTPTSDTTTYGAPYSGQLHTSGGTGDLFYVQNSGEFYITVGFSGGISAPAGLPIGTYTATGTVEDSSNDIQPWSFTLTVTSATLTNATSGTTAVGTAYTGLLPAAGGTTPPALTYAQSTGSPNITIGATGAISAPDTLGVGVYTASGDESDQWGYTSAWSFTLTVSGLPTNFTLTESASNTTYGSPISLGESGIAPAATGTITFTSGINTLCTLNLSGISGEATTCQSPVGLAPSIYPLAASFVDSDDTYASSNATNTVSLVVTAAPLTITASGGTFGYGGTVPTITASYSSFANNDSSTSLSTPPICTTLATSTSLVSGGPYGTSCSGAVDPDYAISYGAGSLIETAAPLTITASGGTFGYGGTVPTITASYSSFANNDSSTSLSTPPTCTTLVSSSSPVSGSPYGTSCSGAVDPNYAISYGAGSLIETAAPLTITASSGTFVHGGAVPAITASYSSFVNHENANSLSTQPTCTTLATSTSPVSGSPYGTSCSGAVDPNYAISYVAGSLIETAAPLATQTISFVDHPPTIATYGGTFTVAATASSGLPVTFSAAALSASMCRVSGPTVTFTGLGTCTIDANQAGSTNYLAAPQVTQGISVTKAPTLVVAAPVSLLAALLSLKVTFSATVTSQTTGKGVSGQTVSFADGKLVSCSATTNSSGVASCSVPPLAILALLLSPSYSASYAGGTDYGASSATGKAMLF